MLWQAPPSEREAGLGWARREIQAGPQPWQEAGCAPRRPREKVRAGASPSSLTVCTSCSDTGSKAKCRHTCELQLLRTYCKQDLEACSGPSSCQGQLWPRTDLKSGCTWPGIARPECGSAYSRQSRNCNAFPFSSGKKRVHSTQKNCECRLPRGNHRPSTGRGCGQLSPHGVRPDARSK